MADQFNPERDSEEVDALLPDTGEDLDSRAEDQPDEDEVRITASERVRQEAREAADRAQQEEKDKARTRRDGPDQRGPVTDDTVPGAVAPGVGQVSGWYLARNGFVDRGDWLSIKGAQRDKGSKLLQVTDDQLRSLLITAVVAKGWTHELALYRGNSIDGQLTTRAQTMFATDPGVQTALRAAGIEQPPQLQKLLKTEPPPWLAKSILPNLHTHRYNQEQRMIERSTNESVRKALKVSRRVGGEAGERMRGQLEEHLLDKGNFGDRLLIGGVGTAFSGLMSDFFGRKAEAGAPPPLPAAAADAVNRQPPPPGVTSPAPGAPPV